MFISTQRVQNSEELGEVRQKNRFFPLHPLLPTCSPPDYFSGFFVPPETLVCSLACLSSPPGKGKGNVCYAGYICSFFSFWTKLSWLNSIDSINFGVIKLTKKFDFVSLIALDCWTNGKTIGGLKFDWFVVWFGTISWLRREN